MSLIVSAMATGLPIMDVFLDLSILKLLDKFEPGSPSANMRLGINQSRKTKCIVHAANAISMRFLLSFFSKIYFWGRVDQNCPSLLVLGIYLKMRASDCATSNMRRGYHLSGLKLQS